MLLEKLTDRLADWLIVYGARVATAAIIILCFWLMGRVCQRIVLRVFGRSPVDENLRQFLGNAVLWSLATVGIVTGLGTAGVNVNALVASLGLTGFALGFALKDIISNALSGIIILLYKPFRFHDRIKVAAVEGQVVSVDLRYTVLHTERDVIYVPNSMLFSNAVRPC